MVSNWLRWLHSPLNENDSLYSTINRYTWCVDIEFYVNNYTKGLKKKVSSTSIKLFSLRWFLNWEIVVAVSYQATIIQFVTWFACFGFFKYAHCALCAMRTHIQTLSVLNISCQTFIEHWTNKISHFQLLTKSKTQSIDKYMNLNACWKYKWWKS